MSMQPLDAARSERGVALIIVLLLLAVMTGLATGMMVSSQVDMAMSSNEVTYAGARAAAEAGMNRAIERIMADTTTNLLAGLDGAVDAANPAAAVNADNGNIAFLLGGVAGPYALGTQYSYTIQVFDDDDPSLYSTALTAAQLIDMGGAPGVVEDGTGYVDTNDRLILRVTGFGPNGTTIRIARILQSAEFTPTTTTTTLANPAILVNGDLTLNGSLNILGSEGNVHANGNLDLTGNAATVTGDATATGTFEANENWEPENGGEFGGGRPYINVPEIKAQDYANLADFILHADGTMTTVPCTASAGPPVVTCQPAPVGWTFSGGTWSIESNTAPTGTFYIEGPVTISGNPPSGGPSSNIALSIIAEGSINITGRPKFTPENAERIQFITNGDLVIGGTADLDDPTTVEGQIMVREQFEVGGNPEFQGRVMVQNLDSATNAYDASTNPYGRKGNSLITSNSIQGNMTVTYNGTLGAIETTTTTSGSTTYTNNVSGWMES